MAYVDLLVSMNPGALREFVVYDCSGSQFYASKGHAIRLTHRLQKLPQLDWWRLARSSSGFIARNVCEVRRAHSAPNR